MIDAKAINTLNSLKQYYNDKDQDIYVGFDDEDNEALEMAIKALEQESVLDKIRAEIEQITDTMGVIYNQYVSKIDVLQIIDKYLEPKAESEVTDADSN